MDGPFIGAGASSAVDERPAGSSEDHNERSIKPIDRPVIELEGHAASTAVLAGKLDYGSLEQPGADVDGSSPLLREHALPVMWCF